jgi:hypothetical protein
MEQEGFVIRVETFVRAIVESLRAIGRCVSRIPLPIDGYEILIVQAQRVAVRASKSRPFKIGRGMYIHGILQPERGDWPGCFCNAPCEFHASEETEASFVW